METRPFRCVEVLENKNVYQKTCMFDILPQIEPIDQYTCHVGYKYT